MKKDYSEYKPNSQELYAAQRRGGKELHLATFHNYVSLSPAEKTIVFVWKSLIKMNLVSEKVRFSIITYTMNDSAKTPRVNLVVLKPFVLRKRCLYTRSIRSILGV